MTGPDEEDCCAICGRPTLTYKLVVRYEADGTESANIAAVCAEHSYLMPRPSPAAIEHARAKIQRHLGENEAD